MENLPRKGSSAAAALLLVATATALAWTSVFVDSPARHGHSAAPSSPPPPSPMMAETHRRQKQQNLQAPTMATTTTSSSSHYHSICNVTLYPRLCLSTVRHPCRLPPRPHHRRILRLHLAGASVRKASSSVTSALSKIKLLLTTLDRAEGPRHKAALEDCGYMLRRSLHLLGKAAVRLRVAGASPSGKLPPPPRRTRVLLSAAMTYQDSCLDGFGVDDPHASAKKNLRERLRPITRLLSNALAIVRGLEDADDKLAPAQQRTHGWRGRSLVGLGRPRPDVVVAKSGGDLTSVSAAVRRAPAWSRRRFVIWVRAGTYEENVVIPTRSTNVVIIGEGWDRTVIAGRRSVAGGSTTFGSATVAVAGAGFLARDIAIINTAGPGEGQAVALRVDADCSAFFRCNISGYQDTLYAHSLSQFYRDCTVRGTVDFIFGNAAAVFQNCRIEVRQSRLRQMNVVTAQGRDDPNQPTGTTLDNCTIVAAADNWGS